MQGYGSLEFSIVLRVGPRQRIDPMRGWLENGLFLALKSAFLVGKRTF